jgi:WD40 repeat protein
MRMRARAVLTVMAGAAMAISVMAPGAAAARAGATSPGTVLWSAQVSAGAATDVAANPRYPIVYVTGWTATSQHERGFPRTLIDDFTTVAYDTQTGAQLWIDHYQGGGYLGQAHPLVAVSPDGTQVYVSGDQCLGKPYCVVHGYPNGIGLTVLAYNATTGALLWQNAPDFGAPPSLMAVSPTGSQLFITGVQKCACYFTTAYNSSDGTLAWQQESIVSRHTVQYEFPSALAVSPNDETLFVTGAQGTIAMESFGAGETQWKRYSAGAVGKSLAVSQDSSTLLVAGCDAMAQRHHQCSANDLTAYDAATGKRLWVLADGADQVVASPSGPQVFVGADVSGHSALAAYDVASGVRTELWQVPSVSGQVEVSPKGQTVFVVGAARIAAYDAATGARLWTASYSYPGTNPVLALSANGAKLVVTGQEDGGYLTMAYRLR